MNTAQFYFFTQVWNYQTLAEWIQQCRNIPTSEHFYQHLMLSVFIIKDIIVGVQSQFVMVLICISLMINDAEHLFTWLWAICILFGETRIQTFCPFFMRSFVFVLSCKTSFYNLETSPLSNIWFANSWTVLLVLHLRMLYSISKVTKMFCFLQVLQFNSYIWLYDVFWLNF